VIELELMPSLSPAMVATPGSPSRQRDLRDHRGWRALGLFSLLGCHVALLAWSAARHSPTIDEVTWLPAGIHHWQTGSFDSAIVNPPLVRLLAAAPVLWSLSSDGQPTNGGTDFVRTYGRRSFWMFTVGRWACIPISLVGAYVCYRWARQLYGTCSAFVALSLWCFSPNILAHGQLIANDCAAASFGVAAAYAFWCWLKKSTWEAAIVAGIILGLAELMKMSLLVLFLAFPAIWLFWRLTGNEPKGPHGWLRSAVQLCGVLFLAVDIINVGYLFEGTGRRLKDFSFVSHALSGVEEQSTFGGNRFVGTFLERLPVPLPANYVLGLDQQKRDLEVGNAVQFSYLRGQWSKRGWWYFYLYALAIKVPLGTWCLLALSAWVRLTHADSIVCWRDEIVLGLPPVILLAVASSQTGFTDHFRYVLPVLPFAFVWISRVANVVVNRPRIPGLLAIAAFAWSIGSSLVFYPHSLSYFNELVGGPMGGHFHLLSSNIDYGQDLLLLKEWADRHPEARPLQLAIWNMGTVDPAVAGIEYTVALSGPPPEVNPTPDLSTKHGPQPGWFAVNVNVLHGDNWPGRAGEPTFGYYGYFLHFTPVATAGFSIYIYHISVADAELYWQRFDARERSGSRR
jgi:hypothetical protein